MKHAAALVIASLGLSGCSFLETLEDCRDLVETINPALESAELDAGAPASPGTLRSVASIYAALAEQLQKKDYGSKRLSALTRQYAQLATEVASNADAHATALERNARGKHGQNKTEKASKQHAARQRTLNRRLERVCSGH